MTVTTDRRPDRRLRLLPKTALVCTSEIDHPDRNYWPLLGSVQRIRFRIMQELLGDAHYDRLLEIGYGSGVFMPELARRCMWLYGIDPHPKAKQVTDNLRQYGVDAALTRGQIEQAPYEDGYFDCVTTISALEYVADIERACAEIRRVLRPGGVFAVITPGANPLWDLALRASTGKSPGQYADRRRRLQPVLRSRFRLLRQVRVPRRSGPAIRLYTGLLFKADWTRA